MTLIEDADFFVRYVKLPDGFAGCCIPNDDTTFSVYLDPRYPQEVLKDTYRHEIGHLRHDDFSIGTDPVEAEKRCG